MTLSALSLRGQTALFGPNPCPLCKSRTALIPKKREEPTVLLVSPFLCNARPQRPGENYSHGENRPHSSGAVRMLRVDTYSMRGKNQPCSPVSLCYGPLLPLMPCAVVSK